MLVVDVVEAVEVFIPNRTVGGGFQDLVAEEFLMEAVGVNHMYHLIFLLHNNIRVIASDHLVCLINFIHLDQ